MISSSDDYYDLQNGIITIKGFTNSEKSEEAKIVNYPKILQNVYCITKDGRVYSMIKEKFISWSIRNGLPYVNLSCVRERGVSLEPFYIRDLMACSYIVNAMGYLERGYHAANIDGDPMNCRYNNIVYINKSSYEY